MMKTAGEIKAKPWIYANPNIKEAATNLVNNLGYPGHDYVPVGCYIDGITALVECNVKRAVATARASAFTEAAKACEFAYLTADNEHQVMADYATQQTCIATIRNLAIQAEEK